MTNQKTMTHKKDCVWGNSDCEYKDAHDGCFHEEHNLKCNCQPAPKSEDVCICPFNDDTAAEIGHKKDCPFYEIDTRWKHITKSEEQKFNLCNQNPCPVQDKECAEILKSGGTIRYADELLQESEGKNKSCYVMFGIGLIGIILGFYLFNKSDIQTAIAGFGFLCIGAVLIGWNGETIWRKIKGRQKLNS